MKDFFRSLNKPMLIASLAFVAFGFLFTVNPNIIREVAISYVIAGALFMYALISVIIYIKTPVGNGFGLVFGLVALCAGVIICFRADEFVGIIRMVIGFGIAVFGIVRFQQGIDLLRLKKHSGWFEVVISVLLIAAGIIVAVVPELFKNAVFILSGILMMVVGVTNIVSEVRTKKAMKNLLDSEGKIIVHGEVEKDGE